MQQEKEVLDNRLGAERRQKLDARKTTGYERRYGEVVPKLMFEPDFWIMDSLTADYADFTDFIY